MTQSSSLTTSVTIHYSVSRYAPQPSQLPQSRNKFCIVTLLSSQAKSACCNTIHCIAIQLPSNPKFLCHDTINCIVTPAAQLFCLNTTTVLCPSLQYTLTYCNTILSSLLHSLLQYNATLQYKFSSLTIQFGQWLTIFCCIFFFVFFFPFFFHFFLHTVRTKKNFDIIFFSHLLLEH